ncbi:hypothetical protein [Skermania piniformis]|uniref:LuxR family transcriptional regulator n=1 Tax=Skermania pinensis TaxID=39122 RepID=A0ABX8S9B6_9ACTN|nr:hypothetical protein [Skermania piniformis]QXQ14407.1 LuxR family transcriptional regulator [Skermania piniformis]
MNTPDDLPASCRTYPRRPALSPQEQFVLVSWLRSRAWTAPPRRPFEFYATLWSIGTKYHDAGRPTPTKAALIARALQDELIELDDLRPRR